MSNRNATASWSGYSHQGQVGLLVALRKLQEQIDLTNHFVQFETYEDVAIYELQADGYKRYLSVHQVKAYYSDGSHLKSTYSSVLNENFDDGNEKFLHTTAEITDWTTSATTNNNNVARYVYNQMPLKNYCGTTEIEDYIKSELRAILGKDEPFIDIAYLRLSFTLDQKIRLEHQKASKSLFDINFSLEEILQIIQNEEDFNKKEILDCRRLFYNSFIEVALEENLTEDHIDSLEANIIREINNLDDNHFMQFLQLLNLNVTPNKLKNSQVFYNEDGLRQVFFKMLFGVTNCNAMLEENSINYSRNTFPNKFVLTAIISDESEAVKVVNNIIENLKQQNLLWENHELVNRNIEIDIVRNNPSIGMIATVLNDADSNKFMSFSKSKLIKRDGALDKLNNGTIN